MGRIQVAEWIVFDAAGTLIQPVPDAVTVYQQLGAAHGFEREVQEVRRRFQPAMAHHFVDGHASEQEDRNRWHSVVSDVFQAKPQQCHELFDALWQYFAAPFHWQLYDDVCDTWSWLTAQGFRLAIASNFDRRLYPIVRALAPICDAEEIFISSEVGYRKPSKHFYHAIQLQLRAAPERLLMVGDDRRADLQGASTAGWQSLLVDRSAAEDVLPMIRCLSSLIDLLA